MSLVFCCSCAFRSTTMASSPHPALPGDAAAASSLSTMNVPSLVMPAPSAHLQAVQQLRAVLAQLTAVTESNEHVAALEGRVAEYESMLGAASLAQRKFIAQIGTLEKQLAEANKKKPAAATSNNHHSAAESHAGAAPTAAAPAAHSSSHPSTAAAHLSHHLNYPAQFESNLAMFLAEHTDEQQAREALQEEVWTWAEFAGAAGKDAAGASAHTLPPTTVERMLKVQLTKPVQLFPCARLGVGLDLGFQQFHSLMYMQAVTSMQLQMP
jgi:hypothetical protein